MLDSQAHRVLGQPCWTGAGPLRHNLAAAVAATRPDVDGLPAAAQHRPGSRHWVMAILGEAIKNHFDHDHTPSRCVGVPRQATG